MSKVAVIGNTARAIGAVCASDLALSGHEVRFAVFPDQKYPLAAVRKAGGFTVEGDAKHLISRKTGFARLDRICDTTREALKDAEERDAALCARLVKECFDSQDYIEGRRAFMEKRKPAFAGR